MNELTREQVEEVFNAVYWHGDQQGAKQCKVLDGIDALRATITQQAQELERVKREFLNKDQIIASLTATAQLALEASATVVDGLLARVAELEQRRSETAAMCEQLTVDLESCHTQVSTLQASDRAYAEAGADNLSLRLLLADKLATVTAERDASRKLYNDVFEVVLNERDSLRVQLAASQARCREMESKEIALKKHIELIQARLEHEVNRPSKLEDDIAQLQATLAAREARIAELEDWQKIVLGSGTEQETVIRMAANEYTKTAVQCWKDHTKKIEAERDTAVQEVGRLKFWVSRLLNDLPTSRDWLDPVIEQNLRGAP